MNSNSQKILLIRFSSFGDVLQTLSVVAALKERWPHAEVHWVTRSEFAPLVAPHPGLTQVWGLQKSTGVRGLLRMAIKLHHQSFTHVYDAHNNLRSLILCFIFWSFNLFRGTRPPSLIRRSLKRGQRFLLFQLRWNFFERPFSGQRDLLEPLQKWGISKKIPPPPQLFLNPLDLQKTENRVQPLGDYIALAPSAAYELKRWPLSHWKTLLQQWMLVQSNLHFVLLGGPEDTFLESLKILNPLRIHNWAGLLSYQESAAVVRYSKLLIANDTGLLHVGEQLGHPTIALMGPAPFGFPSRTETTSILELDLPCRPCSKHGQGPCTNALYHRCLVEISPAQVLQVARAQLARLQRDSSC